MQQYHITGMSCDACRAHVEKAVSAVPGVESCSVNLLTNSMGVEGSASPDIIIAAVDKAGYGASPKNQRSVRLTQSPNVQSSKAVIFDDTPSTDLIFAQE